MARRGANPRIVLGYDDSKVKAGTRGTQQDLGRLAASGEKSFDRLKKGAVVAGAALTGGLVLGLKASADAAIEAEKVQARLEAQLKASNISFEAHAKTIENVIAKHSQLSGLDDEDLTDAFTNIVRVTGDVDKSLRLTGLAADFARAKHMDVAKAGEVVAKVAGGNTGILSRYGIALEDNATASEALAELQQRFAGQSEAYGKTTAGSIDRMHVAAENLAETVGMALAPTLADVADGVANFVTEMQTGTGAGGEFVDALRPIVEVLGDIAGFFMDHPELVAVAVGAWATYKTAALVALGAIKVKHFADVFAQSVPVARTWGGRAGSAFAKNFSHLLRLGIAGVGLAIGTGLAAEIEKALTGWLPGGKEAMDRAKGNNPVKPPADHTFWGDAKSVWDAITGSGDPLPGTPLGMSIVGTASSLPPGMGTSGGGKKGSSNRSSGSGGGSTGGSSVPSTSGGIVALGRWLQSQGFHVSEHPAFGGVRFKHAHYPPHDHYSGGALDVNADGAASGEASRLDWLAPRLRAAGWRVLWRTTDHFDHLHVDTSGGVGTIPGGGSVSGGSSVGSTISAPSASTFNTGMSGAQAQRSFRQSQREGVRAQSQAVKDSRAAYRQGVSDYADMQWAEADLAVTMAGDDPDKLLVAYAGQGYLIQTELESIERKLKRTKNPGKRAALIRRKNELLGDWESLGDSTAAIVNPPQKDDSDLRAIMAEFVENQKRILALAGNGDQILQATIAAVSGGIGGKVGLGFMSAGVPGQVARA